MRGVLNYWLMEVEYKFEQIEETLYLTVNLIDRILAVQSVVRTKLQFVGATAMLIACKYEEVSIPVVNGLVLISDKAYCRKEVLDMETLMTNTLELIRSVPTRYTLMKRFLKAAAQSGKRMELLPLFMNELSLFQYEMLRFPPSSLYAASLFTTQCTTTQWSKTCERHTNYNTDQLMGSARIMVISFHQKCHAAETETAAFLLNDAEF